MLFESLRTVCVASLPQTSYFTSKSLYAFFQICCNFDISNRHEHPYISVTSNFHEFELNVRCNPNHTESIFYFLTWAIEKVFLCIPALVLLYSVKSVSLVYSLNYSQGVRSNVTAVENLRTRPSTLAVSLVTFKRLIIACNSNSSGLSFPKSWSSTLRLWILSKAHYHFH